MGKIAETLRSRKFWAMVSAVTGALASWATGEVAATIAIPTAIGAVLVWINSQGKVDAAKAAANGAAAGGE